MDVKLILDIIVALLLIATISYAVLLNRRLTALRQSRDDMARIISQFAEATVRAESSIPKLRKAADDAGSGLSERVEKAQSLRDDLAFMIERADAMANRLEASVRTARSESKPTPRPAAVVTPQPQPVFASNDFAIADDDEDDDRSEAERELLRALQALR